MSKLPRTRHAEFISPANAGRRVRLPHLRWLVVAGGFAVLGAVMAKSHDPYAGSYDNAPHPPGAHSFEVALPQSPAATPADTALQEAATSYVEWETLTVDAGDSLSALLRQLGIPLTTINRLVRTSEHGEQLAHIRPGQHIRVARDQDEGLQALVHQASAERQLLFQRNGQGFSSSVVENPLEQRLHYASGTLSRSLLAAGSRAGVSRQLMLDLAEIFAWDIDFAMDLRPGDQFHIVHEAYYRNGQHVRDGAIVAAELISAGRSHRAVRYTNAQGKTQFYAPDGTALRRAFLRAPVEYTRITSGFGKRRHPTLHRMREHNGVDYAAPKGTPIRATGDGHIVRHGWQGGYGRTVVIEHGKRYSTLYAHMSRFHPERRVGSRVNQGDVIGYVGASGLATGPHVHYEFLIDDIHHDPQTVELPTGAPVKPDQRNHFARTTAPLAAKLDTIRRTYAAAPR